MSEAPMIEVVDELPPQTQRAQTAFWHAVMEQVKANAGRWCKVPGDFDPSTATHLRKNRNTQVDAEEVEIETRAEPTDDGRKRVSIFLRVGGG